MGCLASIQRMREKFAPPHVIILLGPPAAGKGTLCDVLTKYYGLMHIAPGQILREHVEQKTVLGSKVKSFIEGGQLVPSELVVEIIQDRLSRPDAMSRGVLLENFPLVEDQAQIAAQMMRISRFILLDVSHEALLDRARGRLVDPQTGAIYHSSLRPPPPEVMSRLVRRKDDSEELMNVRLDTYFRHIDGILQYFRGNVHEVQGMADPTQVAHDAMKILDELEWSTDDAPYFANAAFCGPFTQQQARRAGFYSPDNPPEIGDKVVCFRRGVDWGKRGSVSDVVETFSNGHGGLKKGYEGLQVTVDSDNGETFSCWSVFLAPVNDMEYSSLCSTTELECSCFATLCSEMFHKSSDGERQSVCSMATTFENFPSISKEQARPALQDWLANLEDADCEPVDVSADVLDGIMSDFDNHTDASLFLYSTHHKLGPRLALVLGQDYSVYYRALNNTLNSDVEGNLRRAFPLIQRMMYLLLYDETTGERRYHAGGRVWKGDSQRPVPLNMHRLQQAHTLGKVIRFRQFQSTTSDEKLANKYLKREDGRGFKWTIDIPIKFWGARDIQDIAWKSNESETLFPPYSAFRVQSIDADECHLLALDIRSHLGFRAKRQGVRGTPVELLGY
eukprot:TRINITY_DN18017_c0_g6_i1.p1 TRINITY_DN18017_c0_g6~~TRINITY_DN18017_c0_g6_i1.p1  ORF type:complete len:639 (+),score=66.13 TRINITY_DN18017_c0_g6_i1:61-1917(+)